MAVLAAAPALVHQHNNAEPDKRQSVGDRAERRRSSSRAAHRSLKRGRRFEPHSLYRYQWRSPVVLTDRLRKGQP
jgi:hypothetical protein